MPVLCNFSLTFLNHKYLNYSITKNMRSSINLTSDKVTIVKQSSLFCTGSSDTVHHRFYARFHSTRKARSLRAIRAGNNSIKT